MPTTIVDIMTTPPVLAKITQDTNISSIDIVIASLTLVSSSIWTPLASQVLITFTISKTLVIHTSKTIITLITLSIEPSTAFASLKHSSAIPLTSVVKVITTTLAQGPSQTPLNTQE